MEQTKKLKLSRTKGKDLYTLVDNDIYEQYKNKSIRLDRYGYAVIRYRKDGKRKEYKLHRLITECPDHLEVDHINNNPLDNRRENLRCVEKLNNLYNRKRYRKAPEETTL